MAAAVTFSGVVSGINFDSIIQAMLQSKQAAEKPMQNQKTTLGLRKQLYSEIQSSLSSLQSSVNTLLNASQMHGFSATSADTTVLKATASSGAAAGTYNVTVQQLASATQVTSGFVTQVPPILGLGGYADPAQTLNSSAAKMRTAVTTGTFTVNGTQISVDSTTDTLNSVLSRIASLTGITATYDSTNDVVALSSSGSISLGSVGDTSNFLSATNLLASIQSGGPTYTRTSTTHLGAVQATTLLNNANLQTAVVGDGSGAGSFQINGVTVNFNINTDALQDVVNRINQQVPTVIASYDTNSDRIVLLSKTTGSIGISRQDVTGNFLDATGLLDSGTVAQAQQNLGNNAQVLVNGFNNNQPITSTSNNLSNIIPGITLSLVKQAPSQTVQVTVAPDTQTLTNAINDFATRYNNAVSLITTRLTEKSIQNATTDAQKEIGLLTGDPLLVQIKNDLVSRESGPVAGLAATLRQLSQLGVTLSSDNTGQVTVNSATLSQALSDNRDAAYHILFNDLNGNGTVDTGEDGVAVRLQSKLTQILSTDKQFVGGSSVPSGLLPQKESSIDTQVAQLDKRITDFDNSIAATEDALRQKFTNMELKLAELQRKSAGLSALGVTTSTSNSGFFSSTA